VKRAEVQKVLTWLVPLLIAGGMIYLVFRAYISPALLIDFANTRLC